MNAQEFEQLKERSREAWIKMERWRIAYRTDHKSIGKRANLLKWGTVLCGVLTGATSLTFLGADPLKVITGVAGFATGALAVIDKIFQWESSSNEAWRNSKLLEDLQTDLYQYVWSVSANRLIESPENFLTKITNKISNYTSLQCSDPDQFLKQAEEACLRLNFDKMQLLERQVIEEVEDDDLLPEEKEGIEDIRPIVVGSSQ